MASSNQEGFKVSGNTLRILGAVGAATAMLGTLIGIGVTTATKFENHDTRIKGVESSLSDIKDDIVRRLDRVENKVDRLVERK